jgi:hypothetical protein
MQRKRHIRHVSKDQAVRCLGGEDVKRTRNSGGKAGNLFVNIHLDERGNWSVATLIVVTQVAI